MKRISVITAIILCVCLLAGGCASQSNNAPMPSAAQSAAVAPAASPPRAAGMGGEYGIARDMADTEMAAEAPGMIPPDITPPIGGVGNPAVNAAADNRKIIYTADLRMQTKEFDAGVTLVEQLTVDYGGFIQRTSVEGKNLYDYGGGRPGRYASYTLRVPESGMRTFLSDLEQHFNISSSNMYSDDITGTYFDTQARLESLRVQQRKLLEMLDKAEDVTYLLEVQKELARVGYEVEALTSSMNRMDDSVSFSTVNLYIEEVVEYTVTETINTPFTEQIGNTFTGAWRSFDYFCRSVVLGIVSLTPFLVIVLPLVAVAVVLLRLRRRRRKNRAVAEITSQPADAGKIPADNNGDTNG